MMRILYLSTLCSDKEFTYLFNNTNAKVSQQMQKYNLVLARGFAQLEDVNITAISSRPVTIGTHKRRIFRKKAEIENGIEFLYLPFLNIKIIKSIIILISGIINTIRLGKRNSQENSAIVCDALNIPLTIAGITVSKLLNIPVVGIVTDVPGYYASDEGRLSFGRKLFIKIHQYIIRKINRYVFLSKYMNDAINKSSKPFCIIEGQVDMEMVNVHNMPKKKPKKSIAMYAGSVSKANGVDILAEAFIRAGINNTELHIFGSGPDLDELKLLEKKSDKVKFFGSVPNHIVVEKEIEADILINPRPTNREFVKYSFPSKNMEYMASGTPVLTTRIPSMPEEYNEYVYFIDDESVEGLSETIKMILAKPKEELDDMGQMAKEFVLREKNNVMQARKIVNLVTDNKGGHHL